MPCSLVHQKEKEKMNPISRFLKLRKQNNKVKIAVLMFALAIGFAVSAFTRISGFWALSSAASEYILLPSSSGSLAPEKIAWLCGSDDVISASIQRQYTITVGSGGIRTPLSVSEVSSQYLADCFGIPSDISGENVFYVNQSAFDLIFIRLQDQSDRKSYFLNGGAAHQARFLLCNSIPGEIPAVFHAGTSASLNVHTADSVRVMYQNSDITEMREKSLSTAGYMIKNQTDLLKQSYEKQLLINSLIYDTFIIMISLTAGMALLPTQKYLTNRILSV